MCGHPILLRLDLARSIFGTAHVVGERDVATTGDQADEDNGDEVWASTFHHPQR